MQPLSIRSERLSAFAGHEVRLEAIVMTPPDFHPDRGWATHYVVHGFGGSARSLATRYGGQVLRRIEDGDAPPLLRVFLDANHPMGHHVFADSANTGPWGSALVEELIPAIEARYGAIPEARARFVSGHSSGGWSSLWLQVAYPESFGGVWSSAPDPVDFRDFTGIDLYRFHNMYTDPDGDPVPLVWDGKKVVMTFEAYTRREVARGRVGGQIYSFDAVFSPRGEDGQPRFVFDRDTGRIDREVALAWKPYDIRLKVKQAWPRLEPLLRSKLHVIVGTEDTFGLQGAVRLLDEELAALGSDAQIIYVEGRDHGDLFDPHPELYPRGLLARIEDEMWASFSAGAPVR